MPQTFTLLMVDDDEDDKEMLMEAVAEINPMIRCVNANNAFDALQLLKKEDLVPDFIFLDLNMPRLNGKQCLEQLKQNEKLKSIPVIIYTTSKMVEDKEEAKNLGAMHFITKPNNMQMLKQELEYVFCRKGQGD